MGKYADNAARTEQNEAETALETAYAAIDGSPARSRRRDALGSALLALADVCSAALALLIGVSAIGDDVLEPATLAAAPLVAVVGKVMGLYARDEHVLRKPTLDEAPAVFRVAT